MTCTTTQNWPTIDSSWTFTDSTTQFRARRPGSTTDNIIVNIDTTTQRTTSVVRDGATWTYTWSPLGNSLTRTDPFGETITVVSDPNVGLPTSITNEVGDVTTHVYDTQGRRTKTTFPVGNSVEYAYDSRGNVTQVKRVAKPGTGLPNIVTSATYPSTCANPKNCNLPTTTTDARGNVTNYTWNANGDPLTVTLPAPTTAVVRPQARYTYTNVAMAGGSTASRLQTISQCQTQASCAGTADETKTTFTWSNQLLLTGTTQANGTGTLNATTTIGYDGVGNPKTINGPLAGTADTTTMRYDNLRRVVGIVEPDPDGAGPLKHRAERYTYFAPGPLKQEDFGTVTDPSDTAWDNFSTAFHTWRALDAYGRVRRVKLASPTDTFATEDHKFDAAGRLACSITYMDPAVWGPYAPSCAPLQTSGPNGPDRVARIIYDDAGRVSQVKLAVGVSGQEAAERTLTYTPNGRLQTLKDAENNLTTYEYDGHDRLSKTRFPVKTKGANQSSTTDYEQVTAYDPNGNVTQRRMRDGQTIGFGYDALNRMTLMGSAGLADVEFTYDLLGRQLSATFISTGEGVTSNSYDALDRLVSTTARQNGVNRTLSYLYDLAGRRARMTWPDGFYVDYDRLVTGELRKIRENGATLGIGVLATYGYDDLRRRTSLTLGNGTSTSYVYDPVSRLSSMTNNFAGTLNDLTQTFTYNPAHQIVEVTRTNDAYAWTGHGQGTTASTANGFNQLATYTGGTPVYDQRGNMATDPATGNTYAYDTINRLTSATKSGTTSTLSYDPLSRLQWVSSPAGTLRFLYDGLDMVAHYDGAGALQYRYVFGDGVDEPLLQYNPSGVRTWYSADERGSIIAFTRDSGALDGIIAYDEFGRRQGAGGRFQYTGQMWLNELGMYHYKARAYNPQLGRFMQTDPIGYEDSSNLYVYALSDPINLTDPLGSQVSGPDLWVTGYRYRPPAMAIGGANSGIGGLIGEAPSGPDIEVIGKRIRRVPRRIASAPFMMPLVAPGELEPIPAQAGKRDYCTFAPEGLPSGEDFGAACAAHDACYGTLGSSRWACDQQLYRDMVRACIYAATRNLCIYNAQQYLRAVRNYGWLAYILAQRAARRNR